MSVEFQYRIVNAFAADRLAGNPLNVFEGTRGTGDAGGILVAGRVVELGRGTVAL